MSDVYSSGALKVGDKYVLKEDEQGLQWDLLISTETYDSKNRLIVEKMKAGLDPNKAIGLLYTPIESDNPIRLVTVGVKGALYAMPIEDIEANVEFTGASNVITDIIAGSVQALLEMEVSNIPISSMVSVTEDYDGTPIVLTKVTGTPSAGEYSVDLETGTLTIGVATATNYEIVYNIDSGRIKEVVKEKTESLTAASDVVTLTENVSEIISVKDQADAGYLIKYSGTASTGVCIVDLAAGTITFASGDSVTSATVRYKTGNKSLGRTYEKAEAGEPVAVDFEGVNQ